MNGHRSLRRQIAGKNSNSNNNGSSNNSSNNNHIQRTIRWLLFVTIMLMIMMALMSLNMILTRMPRLIREMNQKQGQHQDHIISSSFSREMVEENYSSKQTQVQTPKKHDKLRLRPQLQDRNRTSTRDPNRNAMNMVYPGTLQCDHFMEDEPNYFDHDIVQQMVYWKDIPYDDSIPVSPYYKGDDDEQFLVFEPDESGWNNVRMAFETVVGMAIIMGRTLVLPPKLHFSRSWDEGWEEAPITVMGFEDYFDLMNHTNHIGLKIISFEEFLNTVALRGQLKNIHTGLPSFPPLNNRTNWHGMLKNYERSKEGYTKIVYNWLRSNAFPLQWDYGKCVAAFPAKANDNDAIQNLNNMLQEILEDDQKDNRNWYQRLKSYDRHPTPVNASAKERLREILGHRTEFCMYNLTLQNTKVIHVYGEQDSGYRMLIHFYAFLFTEDYTTDLYVKRFVRDKLRYVDVIHCAAARIVQKVRQIARMHGQADGMFDAMHVRRNDFQHFIKDIFLSADELYNTHTKDYIAEKRTIYISTDEKDLSFFDVFRQHYHVVFLANLLDDIKNMIIPNFYGLVEELVAAKGETFIGTFYSTFSGYINRVRGYYQDDTEYGSINTYYITQSSMLHAKKIMRNYTPVEQSYWVREFPVCWRDIDHDFQKYQSLSTNDTTAIKLVLKLS